MDSITQFLQEEARERSQEAAELASGWDAMYRTEKDEQKSIEYRHNATHARRRSANHSARAERYSK